MQAAHKATSSSMSCQRHTFKSGPLNCVPHRPLQGNSSTTRHQLASHQPGQRQATRREWLGSSLVLSTLMLVSSPAQPAYAGLDRYVKKKQLDPLDTYVPLVLEARGVLAGLDGVMVTDPSTARQMLRSGPFSGMRDNIRALGQYATQPTAEGGAGLSEADATQRVQAFFQSLEAFDLVLYNAVREYKLQQQKADKQSGNDDDEDAVVVIDPAVGLDKTAAAEKLQVAVQKLDQLIATVPADVLSKSEQVLAKVMGKRV